MMNAYLSIRTVTQIALVVIGAFVLSVPAMASVPLSNVPLAGAGPMRINKSATEALPSSLRPTFYRSLARDAGVTYDLNAENCAALPQVKLTACFGRNGAHFTGAGSLALELLSYGRGKTLSPVKPVRPATIGNRVSYKYGDLTTWWRVLPVGFEQGFTVEHPPRGQGKLTLALGVNRTADQGNGELHWGKLCYGKLVVTDATGQVIPATLRENGDRVLITVNDVDAVYPLTVDPLVWIEQKVAASDGAGGDQFGYSVAFSGTTAVIGAPFAGVDGNSDQGAVYIFTESGGTWTEMQKLVESDGAQGDSFGQSVAISGTTVLVGSPHAAVNGVFSQGAAYIYRRSDGTWTEAQELVAEDGAEFGSFGQGVALDGATAFIAAGGTTVVQADKRGLGVGRLSQTHNLYLHGIEHIPADSSPNYTVPGSVYVFNKTNNGNWTQSQKIDSPYVPDAHFGFLMSISGDNALVSAYGANNGEGVADVYTRAQGTWSLEQELTGNDSQAGDLFGSSVALQGTVALVGAEGVQNYSGKAYIFAEAGGSWNQAAELSPDIAGEGEAFGSSVALNGAKALIGAVGYNGGEGKAYLFTESNGTWTKTQEFTPSDFTASDTYAAFGKAVDLSNRIALISASVDTVYGHAFQGAAYFYGASDLGLALSAPQTVGQGQHYTSQTIATNSSSAASPAVSATITVPAVASFVSATASQGSCSEASGVVTCDFGPIAGNAGMATASVTLKATGSAGTTIENTASIAKATPALTASAPTGITSPAACPAGYTEFSGHLDAGESFTSSPITVNEAGQKYVDLTSPASFGFFAIVTSSYGTHTYIYPHVKQGHRWGAAGSYQVGVQAGPSAGGDYTLCVNLNPAQ